MLAERTQEGLAPIVVRGAPYHRLLDQRPEQRRQPWRGGGLQDDRVKLTVAVEERLDVGRIGPHRRSDRVVGRAQPLHQ